MAAQLALLSISGAAGAQPLASLEHHVVGSQLRASPAQLLVPKSLPGSIAVDVVSAKGLDAPELSPLRHGAHVEAVLRGPAFAAYRLLGMPNEPLVLPPLPLVGEYVIDDIRLVDTQTGATLMEGQPSRIPVHVFPEVLVSQVESRPLTLEEIDARGIVIDADSFSAVEFEATFLIEGRRLPVQFPVVTPKWKESTEIIPAAELEERIAVAERINRTLVDAVELPAGLNIPGLDIQLQGLNFQRRPTGGDEPERELDLPPIPGLLVIPGHVGFLNQFFSVQVFTANAAPRGSGLSVHQVFAEITLPPGRDEVAGNGDDPLALARTGPTAVTTPRRQVMGLGRDGLLETTDDEVRLAPGQTGQAEFLVEGRQPGLHLLNIRFDGLLDGYAHGEVVIEGRAAGSVLVRNPRFSIVFSHPRTVRSGNPYTAAVTVLNTSEIDANLVSVSLPAGRLSGARLAAGQSPTMESAAIAPGDSHTFEFDLVAERTGAVTFSNLTVGDQLSGRFDLTMGVDERGVALSPGVIGYPHWVDALPASLRQQADRVLGHALSVATAATLPPGVRAIEPDTVRARVVELAEAGQRLRYSDAPDAVYLDLLLDWHGGRRRSLGFDQILRETAAGHAFEAAIPALLDAATTGDPWLAARASDIAGRQQAWGLASTGDPAVMPSVTINEVVSGPHGQDLTEAGLYGGPGGWLAPVRDPGARAGEFEVTFTVPAGATPTTVAWVTVDGAGAGTRSEWTVSADPVDATCYRYLPRVDPASAIVDVGCDLTSDSGVAVAQSGLTESLPGVVSAEQDLEVLLGRPDPFCGGPSHSDLGRTFFYGNYGTLVAVLFSKPMSQDALLAPGVFRLDRGVATNGVSLQPGGRVALVNLSQGIGALTARSLIVSGAADVRGNLIPYVAQPIVALASEGVSVAGRVVAADGSPAADVPVTLTMQDQAASPAGCGLFERRISQVRSGADGAFSFDFVTAGMGYKLSATDTRGLGDDAVDLLLAAAPTGELTPEEIARLVNQPGGAEAFLAAFGGRDLRGSVAIAEGVDRAVFRDFVSLSSPRVGAPEPVPVVLRFRGRGTVRGVVVQADGVTPVFDAAVNLFPDVGSREKGRGVFTDAGGYFEFAGVPLGAFTVEAQTSSGLHAIVADRLDAPGEVREVTIPLVAGPPAIGQLAGTVRESDGTPHPGAQVLVRGPQGPVALVTADAAGVYSARDIPVGSWDVIAITYDGNRSGRRSGVAVQANLTSYVDVVLPGVADVSGRVVFTDGSPAIGAQVAGGETLVTTDAAGDFVLRGVPVGARTISAGLPADPSVGIDFTRVGSARLDVLPGANNYVTVELSPAGRVHGTVTSAADQPVAGIRVAIPSPQGFFWTQADAQGRYRLDNLALGTYLVVAPAPAVVDASGLAEAIAGGSMDQLRATLGGAFDLYSSGFGGPYAPSQYGFARANLVADGQSAVANIKYLSEGTIDGAVVNHAGTPIGAEVRILGLRPRDNGAPGTDVVAVVQSDPASGQFSFAGLRPGHFSVIARSPFYTEDAIVSGQTSPSQLDAPGLVVQFPAPTNAPGRITGVVLRDGVPVSGATVEIDRGPNYAVTTDPQGTFDTGTSLTPRTYRVLASHTDASDTRVAFATAYVNAGATTELTLDLLAEDGGLAVTVVEPAPQGGLQLVAGADVTVERLDRPSSGPSTQTTNSAGLATFSQRRVGRYAVLACHAPNQTTRCSRATATVSQGASTAVTVTIEGTATVSGVFLQADGTPVGAAQVTIGQVALATTDPSSGAFTVDGVPLGTYRVLGFDALTGRSASSEVILTQPGQTAQLVLQEDPLGEVRGRVIGSDGTSPVGGAFVSLRPSSPLFPPTTVTSDGGGQFTFSGVPPGEFVLSARQAGPEAVLGRAVGQMPASVGTVFLDVALDARASLTITVFRSGGALDPTAEVLLGGNIYPVDPQGAVTIAGLPLGRHTLLARSTAPSRSRSTASRVIDVTAPGAAAPLSMTLRGVGTVAGTLRDAANNLVPSSPVSLQMRDEISGLMTVTQATDTSGAFSFSNVAIGAVTARATSGSLAAEGAAVTTAGSTVTVDLQFGPAATVLGAVVRSDGTTPVAEASVTIRYVDQAGANAVRATTSTATGQFSFAAVPLGDFTVDVSALAVDGVARVSGAVPSGATSVDLGAVRLDEQDPTVAATVPADGATDVPEASSLHVDFSEAMDPSFDDVRGVYLARGLSPIPASLTWQSIGAEAGFRRLSVSPTSPLSSQTTYVLSVTAGDLLGNSGQLLRRGPVDLAQRPLTAPVTVQFTTRDAQPPVLLSQSPVDGAEQAAVETVLRVTFSEPVDASAAQLTLTAGGTAVAGVQTSTLDRRALVFAPATNLAPNTHYTATLSGVVDLAVPPNGLVDALGSPIPTLTWSFDTVDTLGPVIADLQPERAPIAGAPGVFRATLAASEPGVQIQASLDAVSYHNGGIDSPLVTTPALTQGAARPVYARAVDRFGNHGPLFTASFDVAANTPPQLTLTQLVPASGPLLTGQAYHLLASATDDHSVTHLDAQISGAFSDGFAGNTANIPLTGVVPATIGAPGSVVLSAVATDSSGVSASDALTFAVADGTAPALAVTGPSGPLVPPGSFVFSVAASDAFGLADVSFAASGVVSATGGGSIAGAPATSNPAFTLDIPNPPPSGGEVRVTIDATDVSGLAAAPYDVTFPVTDVVPPSMVAVSPSDGAVDVALDATVSVQFSEGVYSVAPSSFVLEALNDPNPPTAVPAVVQHVAGTTAAQLIPSAPLNPSQAYRVVLTAAIHDGAQPLVASATTFTTSSGTQPGPTLVSTTPAESDGAVGLYPFVDVGFDAPIDLAALPAGALTLERDLPGATPASAVLIGGLDNDTRLRFQPSAALEPGVGYLMRVSGLITGPNGDRIRDAGGANFAEHVVRFTTRAVDVVLPTPALGVEGYAVAATLLAEPGQPILQAEWKRDGLTLGTDARSPPRWDVPLSALPGGVAAPAQIEADVAVQGVPGTVAASPATVVVHPGSANYDSDGLTNAQEAGFGTNPWVHDSDDDPDGDGRSNLVEFEQGTDPHVPDAPASATSGPRPPVAGQRLTASETFAFRGVAGSTTLHWPQPNLRIQPPFTWELWVKPGSTSAGSVLTSGTNEALAVDYDPTSGLFSVLMNTAAGTTALASSTPRAANNWWHVAVTHDGARATLYVGGHRHQQAPHSGALQYASGESFAVGPAFTGTIDDVRLWSVARTGLEIQRTALRELSGTEPGLLGYWRLDDTGAQATDHAGTAHGVVGGGGAAWTGSGQTLFVVPSVPVSGSAVYLLDGGDLDSGGPNSSPLFAALTRLPSRGTLRQTNASGSVITSTVGYSQSLNIPYGPKVHYTADPGFFGLDTIEYTIADADHASEPVVVTFDSRATKTWVGGAAGAPADWHQAANWSPSGVPTSSDTVLIPASAGTVVDLSADAGAGTLSVGAGAVVDLGPHQLVGSGHLINHGTMVGPGKVVLTGGGVQIRGALPNLDVAGQASLSGPVDATGDVAILVNGRLAVGPHPLTIGGDLVAGNNSAKLVMTDPAGVVDVAGAARFGHVACSQEQTLTQGELRVAGDFLALSCTAAFQASGGHRVVLDGASPQSVTFDYPAASYSRFQDLVVRNPAGVTFVSDVVVLGTLTVEPGAQIVGGQAISSSALQVGLQASIAGVDALVVAGQTDLADQASVDATTVDLQGATTLGAGSALTGTAVRYGDVVNADPTATQAATGLTLARPGDVPADVAFTHLTVAADIALTQALIVVGDLSVTTAGILRPSGRTVTAGGALTLLGAFDMSAPADVVDVAGDITIGQVGVSCGAFSNNLVDGVLRGAGSFTVAGNCTGIFAATGLHQTILQGGSGISIAVPASDPALSLGYRNQFQGLEVHSSPAAVSTDLLVAGAFVTTADLTAAGRDLVVLQAVAFNSGSALAARDLDVGGVFTQQTNSTITGLATARLASLGTVSGSLSAGTLELGDTSAGIPSTMTFSHLQVAGAVTLTGPLDLGTTGDITVLWAAGKPGRLDTGQQIVTARDLFVDGELVMAGGLLDLAGDLTIGNAGCGLTPATAFAGGTIELEGDLFQEPCIYDRFRPAPAHWVVFDGAAPQFATLSNPSTGLATGSHFGGVQIRNPQGVTFVTDVEVTGDLVVDPTTSLAAQYLDLGGPLSQSGSLAATTLRISDTASGASPSAGLVIIAGAASTVPDWAYADLRIDSTAAASADHVLGGQLEVRGALTVGPHQLTAQGGLLVSGALNMTDPLGRLVVSGDAQFGVAGCPGTVSNLREGVLTLHGDLTQINGCTAASFAPVLNHLTVLASSDPQVVTFASPSTLANATQSHFAAVSVTGDAAFASRVTATQGVTVSGHLTVNSGQVCEVGGALTVTATGHLTNHGMIAASSCQSAGTIDGTGGTPAGCP